MAFTIMRTAFRTRRSRYVSLLVLLAIVAARSSSRRRVRPVPTSAPTFGRRQPRRVAGSVRSDPIAQLMGEARAPVAQEQAPWIVAENERPGTSRWRIPQSAPTSIEGFADAVSAQVGDKVTLYVSTPADTFHVEAYRIGYYDGTGGRLIWRSRSLRGHEQRGPTRTGGTNMIEAPWSPSARVHIGRTLAARHLRAEARRQQRRAELRAADAPRRLEPRRTGDPELGDHLAGVQRLGRIQPVPRPRRLVRRPFPRRVVRSPLRGEARAPAISSGSSRRSCTSPSGWGSTSRTGRTSTCTDGRGC